MSAGTCLALEDSQGLLIYTGFALIFFWSIHADRTGGSVPLPAAAAPPASASAARKRLDLSALAWYR